MSVYLFFSGKCNVDTVSVETTADSQIKPIVARISCSLRNDSRGKPEQIVLRLGKLRAGCCGLLCRHGEKQHHLQKMPTVWSYWRSFPPRRKGNVIYGWSLIPYGSVVVLTDPGMTLMLVVRKEYIFSVIHDR